METYRELARLKHKRFLEQLQSHDTSGHSSDVGILVPVQCRSAIVTCPHHASAKCMQCLHVPGDLRDFAHKHSRCVCFHRMFQSVSIEQCKLPTAARIHQNSFLQYGEITFWAFVEILAAAQPKTSDSFADLGSGIGKAAAVAALCFEFKRVTAIEIVPKLHETAVQLVENHCKNERDEENAARLRQIDFVLGDIFEERAVETWKEHSIVFVSTTCFTEHMLNRLTELIEVHLSPGARVITLSIGIKSSQLRLVHSGKYKMSWGNATVFIHEKL